MVFNEQKLHSALKHSWSKRTAVQWTKQNPAAGQCNVTSAVVRDLFGGEVLRTKVSDTWHYYNRINGKRIDFTDSHFTASGALFSAPETYLDEVSSTVDAMQGISPDEYNILREALLKNLPPKISGD